MAAGAAFAAADVGVEGCPIGAVLSFVPFPPGRVSAGTAAAATVEVFGIATPGFEAEAGATVGVGTAAGSCAGSCSLAWMDLDSPSG